MFFYYSPCESVLYRSCQDFKRPWVSCMSWSRDGCRSALKERCCTSSASNGCNQHSLLSVGFRFYQLTDQWMQTADQLAKSLRSHTAQAVAPARKGTSLFAEEPLHSPSAYQYLRKAGLPLCRYLTREVRDTSSSSFVSMGALCHTTATGRINILQSSKFWIK